MRVVFTEVAGIMIMPFTTARAMSIGNSDEPRVELGGKKYDIPPEIFNMCKNFTSSVRDMIGVAEKVVVREPEPIVETAYYEKLKIFVTYVVEPLRM